MQRWFAPLGIFPMRRTFHSVSGSIAARNASCAKAWMRCLPFNREGVIVTTLDLDALGDVPVLGVVPAFLPADPQGWYPDGVVPAVAGVPADGPPLRPRFLSRPTAGGAAAPLQPVVDTLVDEVGLKAALRPPIRKHASGLPDDVAGHPDAP